MDAIAVATATDVFSHDNNIHVATPLSNIALLQRNEPGLLALQHEDRSFAPIAVPSGRPLGASLPELHSGFGVPGGNLGFSQLPPPSMPLPAQHKSSGAMLLEALGPLRADPTPLALMPAQINARLPVPATVVLFAGICFVTGLTVRRRRSDIRPQEASVYRRPRLAQGATPQGAWRFDPAHNKGGPAYPRFSAYADSTYDSVVVLGPVSEAPRWTPPEPEAPRAETAFRADAGNPAHYRMFTLDAGSVRSCHAFLAGSDDAALIQARRCEPKQGFELWRGGIKVASQPLID